jgi:hypothetical protein
MLVIQIGSYNNIKKKSILKISNDKMIKFNNPFCH